MSVYVLSAHLQVVHAERSHRVPLARVLVAGGLLLLHPDPSLLLPMVDESGLEDVLNDHVEPLAPRVEPVEPPAGVVGHEDGVLGPVDQRVPLWRGVVDVDGRIEAGLPVNKNA